MKISLKHNGPLLTKVVHLEGTLYAVTASMTDGESEILHCSRKLIVVGFNCSTIVSSCVFIVQSKNDVY